MQNIFDSPYASPLIEQFVENATAQIAKAHQGKQWLFLGDTDHSKPGIFDFVYSRAAVSTLAGMGVKHLFIEKSVNMQVFVDALLSGQLTPEQYAATIDATEKVHRTSKPVKEAQRIREASGLKHAHELGMSVTAWDISAGTLKRGCEKKFHYNASRRNKFWLEYLLEHPKYFSDPVTLANSVAETTAPACRIKYGKDLAVLTTGMSPQEIIFLCFIIENLGKKFLDLAQFMDLKAMAAATHADVVSDVDSAWIRKRLAADQHIFKSMQSKVGNDGAALLSGDAHIRYMNELGFPKSLTKDQFTVCLIIDNPSIEDHFETAGVAHTIQPDDLYVFTRQLETVKGKDISLTVPRRTNRLQQILTATPR